MSLRHEQHRALLATREFLLSLQDPSKTPRAPKPIRKRALDCLRHFPFLKETGEPMFSKHHHSHPHPAPNTTGQVTGQATGQDDDTTAPPLP